MARVIKASGVVVPRGVAEAKAEAQRVLSAAQAEAERVVHAARDEAAELARDTKEKARAEAAAELVEAAGSREALLGAAEREITELALAAATKIVEAHVSVGPSEVARLVLATIERARRAKKVVVTLHPDDATALSSLAGTGIEIPTSVSIATDASFVRGDCVVRSELGTIDARVSTKVAALAGALLGRPR